VKRPTENNPVNDDMKSASQNFVFKHFNPTYNKIPKTKAIPIPARAESGTGATSPAKKNGIKKTPASAVSRQIFQATLNHISFTDTMS
jgi:hypothetical protein